MPLLSRFFATLFRFIQTSPNLDIYTDGSSKNGFGSWAFIISRNGQPIVERSGRVRRASSNVMEFQAAIEALGSLPANSKVTLFSDSRILVDAMKSGAGPRAYQDQMDTLMRLNEKHTIKWQWIKAHNGIALNELCDALCTLARSG
jgi:ribonuclease HI